MILNYKNIKVKPVFGQYFNGRLALTLITVENGINTEVYGVPTVNIDEPLSNNYCQFIDTNNFGEDIIDFLIRNNFGKLTNKFGHSGFCTYPEFEFDKKIVKEHKV